MVAKDSCGEDKSSRLEKENAGSHAGLTKSWAEHLRLVVTGRARNEQKVGLSKDDVKSALLFACFWMEKENLAKQDKPSAQLAADLWLWVAETLVCQERETV